MDRLSHFNIGKRGSTRSILSPSSPFILPKVKIQNLAPLSYCTERVNDRNIGRFSSRQVFRPLDVVSRHFLLEGALPFIGS